MPSIGGVDHQWLRSPSLQRVVAVIPALNEAPAIAQVVTALRRQDAVPLDRIIVVDNGSIDTTAANAQRAGAQVVREERQGYGFACRAGIDIASDADVIVLLDGDAADDPGDLPHILQPVLHGEADLVVGSRVAGVAEQGAMTRQQHLGNRLAIQLISMLVGDGVTDLGPFRAIRREALLRLGMREMTYGWSTEMTVKALRAGYRYQEVPVRYCRRIGTSKVSGTIRGSVGAGVCILAAVVRYARWSPAVDRLRTEVPP
jgi:glycosyltransferase involved in cell wall biosynthesis